MNFHIEQKTDRENSVVFCCLINVHFIVDLVFYV